MKGSIAFYNDDFNNVSDNDGYEEKAEFEDNILDSWCAIYSAGVSCGTC